VEGSVIDRRKFAVKRFWDRSALHLKVARLMARVNSSEFLESSESISSDDSVKVADDFECLRFATSKCM
jgi:hypothetical protein